MPINMVGKGGQNEMAQDIVPILNERIQTSFKKSMMSDRQVRTVSKRIRDGTANLRDAHTYAQAAGENLSKALVGSLTQEALPNGTLYYNIAERTVVPALEENYNLVNETAAQIQKLADKKAKIGLGSVRADFPEDRIQGLIDKMTTQGITYDDAIRWLLEPIVNNSEAFVDDFVDANAKFRTEAGLKTKIIRTADPKCCDWCAALEGTYDYGNAPPDIYRRHEFCRCTVTYQSEKQSQNVWSKRTWETSKEDLEKRQAAGQRQELTVQERQEQLERLKRDAEIKRFIDETGYDRTTARKSTQGKTPEQVDAAIKKIKERQAKLVRR